MHGDHATIRDGVRTEEDAALNAIAGEGICELLKMGFPERYILQGRDAIRRLLDRAIAQKMAGSFELR